MPRAKTTCARTPGHGGDCMTATNMANRREYNRLQIHVDHDHDCCRRKNRSCGECIRGLLCHICNVALGYIERRYAMARAYLDSPPVRLLAAA